MTAIGLAQTEKADDYKLMRIHNADIYQAILKDVPGIIFQKKKEDRLHVHWMNAIVIDPAKYGHTREELMAFLKTMNIDTRLLFVGMQKQPSLQKYGCDASGNFPVTDWLSENGLYLPSSSSLRKETIEYICNLIIQFGKK